MTDIRQDASEFGMHVRAGGWRLGLLVARSVERGTAGRPRRNPVDQPENGKVSASRFAEMAGLLDHKIVLRYLDAWERAANIGQVPHAADLSPGQEVRIDEERLGKFRVTDPEMTVGRTAATVTTTLGTSYEPERSGTKQTGRLGGNGGHSDSEDREPGGLAHQLIMTAVDALGRLATHRSSWQFMTERDYKRLGEIPDMCRNIQADVDHSGTKLRS